MKLVVPPDIESALSEQALKCGQTPQNLALRALRERFVHVAAPADSTNSLADFLAGHVGVLSSSEFVAGGAGMSDNCGRKFTDALTANRDQGRL